MTAIRSKARSVPSDRLFTSLGGIVLAIAFTLAVFWVPLIIIILALC
jgi:hypothetical protein